MKGSILEEPELMFGTGRHIDVRFGILNYGPFDVSHALAPKQIRVGIVGTPFTVDGVRKWFEKTSAGVAAKQSGQPNLFPRFPGFGPDSPFSASLLFESRIERAISPRDLNSALKGVPRFRGIAAAVDLFMTDIRDIADRGGVDVILCAIPLEVAELADHDATGGDDLPNTNVDVETPEPSIDFHDALKAQAMALRKPLQLILPGTFDERLRPHRKDHRAELRQLQDEATRAWNIYTALYYKAGGIPWRLIRDPSQLTTCYVGISFFESRDRGQLRTSLAQIFDERGEGVIVRGGPATISKDDRQPHLTEADAEQLLAQVLNTYRQEHKTFPARVVIHKSSKFTPDERSGFTAALPSNRIASWDFLSLRTSTNRVFRVGAYPPLRGTLLELDDRSHVLYTKGSVSFFETYPGLYVPLPLAFRCEDTEPPPTFLAEEILALTKMNWNNTQFDGREPITLRAARQVGGILRYIRDGQGYEARYAYYM